MAIQSPFGRRVFVQAQTGGLLAVNNTGGAWNGSGAQYIRITENSCRLTPEEPLVATNIMHGTASQLQRIGGRKSGAWEMSVPICPSGTQAVAPDTDLVFQSIFGGAGANATGTAFGSAWQYTVKDRQAVPLFVGSFNHGDSTTGNQYAMGCVPQTVSIDLNGNILGMNVRGVCVGVVDDSTFSVVDSVIQGGLTAFPPEPGSFSTTGSVINAFGGTLKINGQTFSNLCDQFSLNFTTGQALKNNYVDSAYPAAIIYSGRSADVTVGFVNTGATALNNLKQWSRTKQPVNVEFDLGTNAGYRVIFQVNGVQFVADSLSDSNGFVSVSFANNASSVAPGASNDLVIGFA